MTAIVKEININFGALLLQWIGNWIQAAEKSKGSRKMFYGRFISILLQSALGDKIEDNEGEALNANKRMTQKLFENWKRNPVENRKLIQSEESGKSQSEEQRPSLKKNLPEDEEISEKESPMLIRKSKGKKKKEKEIQQDTELQGIPTEESDDPLTVEHLSSSTILKKRKSSEEGTDEITPISQMVNKGKRSKRAKKTSLSTIAEHPLSPIVESRFNEDSTQLAMTDAEPEPSVAIAVPESETPQKDSDTLSDSLNQTEAIKEIIATINAELNSSHSEEAPLPAEMELIEENHSEGEHSGVPQSTFAPTEGEIVEQGSDRVEVETPCEESEDEDVEIIAIGRNEQRHTSYQCLFNFLPMMPFYQALVHNAWTQLFWTFKVYPNVTILAHRYPGELNFAQKMLTNSSSSVHMQKVSFVPKHFMTIHNPSHQFHCFDPQNPPVVESLNSTTADPIHPTINAPTPQIVESLHSTITPSIVECPEAQPTISPTPSPVQLPQQPPLLQLTLHQTPSTSRPDPVDIHQGRDDVPANEDSRDLLKQILDRVSQIPTVEGLTELTAHMETEVHDDIAKSSSDLHARVDDIIQAANHLPGNLGRELTTRMRTMFKTVSESLQSRDALFLSEIAKHRTAVDLLQATNDKSIALLSQQVFDMKSMLRDHLFSSDSTIARLQAQQDKADARFQEHRSDVAASQNQMTELIQSLQLLTDTVKNKDDANKGENATTDRGRRGGRGERGGRTQGSRMVQTSIHPPRFEASRPPSLSSTVRSSQRPSSSNTASDMQRWHQEIAIKEEEAIIREEMELRREEEERSEHLRKREEERKDRQRR